MSVKASYPSNWIIVGVSFTAMAVVYSVWYSFAVFFVALLNEFGWRRSVIAGAFSVFVMTHSAIPGSGTRSLQCHAILVALLHFLGNGDRHRRRMCGNDP
jgi:hypothetical protein